MIEFFPYPLLTGLLIIILVGWRLRGRGWLYLLGLALFGLYLLALVGLVYFPIPIPAGWPANLNLKTTRWLLSYVNLVPFRYGNTSLFAINARYAFPEVAGNILLTVPFGIGASFLSRVTWKRLLWLAPAVGLALEGAQLLLVVGLGGYPHSVDINDVLFNALGVLIGAGLYRAAAGGLRRMMA